MYTRTDYRAAAQQAVSSYEDKSRLELQFLEVIAARGSTMERTKYKLEKYTYTRNDTFNKSFKSNVFIHIQAEPIICALGHPA